MTEKTLPSDAPSLAIPAGLPETLHGFIADVAACAGWKTGAEGAVSVAVEEGFLSIRSEGAKRTLSLPFRAAHLIEILKGLQRQSLKLPGEIPVGPYILRPHDYLLLEGENDPIRLTEKETAILVCLSSGKTVARTALLEGVWAYVDGVETHTLETHIYRLRQKIEKDPPNPAILITEDDGYRIKF